MITEDKNDDRDENGSTEFTSNHANREYYNSARQNEPIEENDQQETNVEKARSENDDYPNTGTAANYSASDRKEKFTDENYGMAGQHTRKDIINKFENNDDDHDKSDK